MNPALLFASLYICITVGYCQMCPKGFFNYQASCYIVLDEVAPWIVALDYCRAFGMNLAIIGDASENQFIQNYLYTNRNNYSRASDIWIAGSHILSDAWVWSGAGQGIQDFFWGPGEPSGAENCLSLFAPKNYTWNDEHCTYNGYPLCEKGLSTNPGQGGN